MSNLKNGIPSQLYYKLLEWKDQNLERFKQLHPNKGLNDLSPNELIALHEYIKSTLK